MRYYLTDHLSAFIEHIAHLNKIMSSIAYQAIFYCLDPSSRSAIMVGKDAARVTRQLSQSNNKKFTINGYVKLRDKNGRRTKTGYVVKIE